MSESEKMTFEQIQAGLQQMAQDRLGSTNPMVGWGIDGDHYTIDAMWGFGKTS
jgi:hypothetical protein